MTLRTDLIKIASDLPEGDPTRRKLLSALKGARAEFEPGDRVQRSHPLSAGHHGTVVEHDPYDRGPYGAGYRPRPGRVLVRWDGTRNAIPEDEGDLMPAPRRAAMKPKKTGAAALSDNINVRLMKRDIDQFIKHQLAVLEGAEEPVSSAARAARVALVNLASYL